MKGLAVYICLMLLSYQTIAQITWFPDTDRQREFYGGWGWNRASYTKSDIHFTGDQYDFTLHEVAAKDRQTAFKMDVYFGLKTVTIPQTNFRFGYFLNKHWAISVGVDHMKYVMTQHQTVAFSGDINDTSYQSIIDGNTIQLEPHFLRFEHTDGLNYIHAEAEYYQGLAGIKHIKVNGYFGAGMGFMLPKSNVTLMHYDRHDDFHVSGYGLSAKAGLELLFWKYFFIRLDYKTGFINMPDILTRNGDVSDRASQHFFFAQRSGLFGFNVPIKKERAARAQKD